MISFYFLSQNTMNCILYMIDYPFHLRNIIIINNIYMKSKNFSTRIFSGKYNHIIMFISLFIILILFVYGIHSKSLEGMTDETDTSTSTETAPSSTSSSPEDTTSTSTSTGAPTYYDTNAYNHYSGTNIITFYAPDGTTAYVTTLTDGTKAIIVDNTIYTISPPTPNVYQYNGNTAIVTTVNNQPVIKITRVDGTVVIYSPTRNTGVTYNQSTDTASTFSTTNTINSGTVTYTGPYGTTATVTTLGGITEIAVTFRNNNSSIFYIDKNNTGGNIYIDAYGDKATLNQSSGTIVVTTRHGETLTYTRVSGTTGYNTSQPVYSSTPSTVSSTSVTNPYTGNTAGSITGPNDNSVYYVNNKPLTTNYVPPGDEDLYILKSQVVPPVCPVCPPQIVKKCDKEKECGPCPIQRCPTAPFKCVKEPDYSNPTIKQYLPIPVLNSFSTFGL